MKVYFMIQYYQDQQSILINYDIEFIHPESSLSGSQRNLHLTKRYNLSRRQSQFNITNQQAKG
ncbi:hypothetical protein pb186bvf_007194 [Paramecium bursaria]